jgi:hypothetical protein
LCLVSAYSDLINISAGKLISAHFFLFSHEAGVSRLVLGRDFNSRGMETCRGSIPPPWRHFFALQLTWLASMRPKHLTFLRSSRRHLDL